MVVGAEKAPAPLASVVVSTIVPVAGAPLAVLLNRFTCVGTSTIEPVGMLEIWRARRVPWFATPAPEMPVPFESGALVAVTGIVPMPFGGFGLGSATASDPDGYSKPLSVL